MPKSNPIELAKNLGVQSRRTPQELGEYSRILKEIAALFEGVGEKEESKRLKGYARGFNLAAGKIGLTD